MNIARAPYFLAYGRLPMISYCRGYRSVELDNDLWQRNLVPGQRNDIVLQ